MSWWVLPTTADVGLRAFADSPQRAYEEVVRGMQSILLSEKGAAAIPDLDLQSGVWNIHEDPPLDGTESENASRIAENLLVTLLEEVLYQGEVESRWLVDVEVRQPTPDSLEVEVQWVDADAVEREVEIKAVTRHELQFREVPSGVTVEAVLPDIPAFEGPGWMCQVIFDI
jgi:SHS2 domain-containing protein